MNEDDLRNYEREAESRYDDYDDDSYEEEYDEYDDEYGYEDEYDEYEYDEDGFDTGFEGRTDQYDEDGYEEVEYITTPAPYENYDATSIGKIDPNDRTLTITITNVSGVEAEAIIFGGNQNAAQPVGVTVIVGESSHNEVREESKANPFRIQGMKMSVSDPLQFDRVLRIVRRTSTGANYERVYQPRNATSPQNFSQQLIDDAAFEMDVTGQDSLRFFIKAGASVGFTFTIKARANMGNLLKGSNVAELSTAPRTTGLPQIDLMRSQPMTQGLGAPRPTQTVRKVRRIKKRPKRAAKVAKKILMPHTGLKKLFKRRRRRKKKR